MPNKAYNRGSAFERRIKRELEETGPYYVSKSGGSRGKADLVAVDTDGTPYFFQCKKDGKISPHERQGLYDLGQKFNTSTYLISKPKRKEPIECELIYIGTRHEDPPYDDLGWREIV